MEGMHDLTGGESPPSLGVMNKHFYEDPPLQDLRSLGSMGNVVLQPPERAFCDYYEVKDLVNGVSYSLKTVMDMLQTLTCRVNDVDKVSTSVLTQVTTLKWLTHEMHGKVEKFGEGSASAKMFDSQLNNSMVNDPMKSQITTPSTITGSNKKLKTKMPVNAYSDVMFTVSDSENDDDMDLNDKWEFEMVEKPEEPVPPRDKGKKVMESDYCARPSGKGIQIRDEVLLQRSPLTGKTLFPSPSIPRVISMSATIHDNDLTPTTGGGSDHVTTPRAPLAKRKTSYVAPPPMRGNRPYGFTLPRKFKCKFRPTPEMEMTQKEVQLCAYLYNPDHEDTELVFRYRQTMALRMDLDCLLPGKRVSDEVMKIFTLKVTWSQNQCANPCVWCLPPSFSDAVRDGVPMEDMIATFVTKDNWMPAYPNLKYVYAPVRDESHWYLMVISIEDEALFHLDSYLPIQKVNSRKGLIRDMAQVLGNMLQSECYPTSYMQKAYTMETWDIKEGKGIPNCGRSDDSSIWVLDWIDREHAFQQNLIGVLKEKVVRMRAALSILIEAHNEFYDSLVKKASIYWKTMTEGDNIP